MKLKCAAILGLLMANGFAMTGPQRTELIEKLCYQESRNNPRAIGDNGKALGILQIWKITVDDANRIAKTSYSHQDMMNPEKAREVAEIVLRHYDRHIERTTGKPATAKHLAFIWNGGGGAWKRVDTPQNDSKQRNLEAYWSKLSSR